MNLSLKKLYNLSWRELTGDEMVTGKDHLRMQVTGSAQASQAKQTEGEGTSRVGPNRLVKRRNI